MAAASFAHCLAPGVLQWSWMPHCFLRTFGVRCTWEGSPAPRWILQSWDWLTLLPTFQDRAARGRHRCPIFSCDRVCNNLCDCLALRRHDNSIRSNVVIVRCTRGTQWIHCLIELLLTRGCFRLLSFDGRQACSFAVHMEATPREAVLYRWCAHCAPRWYDAMHGVEYRNCLRLLFIINTHETAINNAFSIRMLHAFYDSSIQQLQVAWRI